MKQVIEIIERCAEGTCVSRPFLVRADDGHLYWIKGCGSGWNRKELCFELLAARLASGLNLPVAGYEILNVAKILLEFCAVPGIRDLSPGPAFGSLHVDDTVSLPPVEVRSIPEELRWKVLLFDWWVQNEDRILGDSGGNVNLLWSPAGKQVTLIDHNNAFDNDFDEKKFFQNHVFGESKKQIPDSFLLEQMQAFEKMTRCFETLSKDFPEEWSERDNLPGDFIPETVCNILSRFDKLSAVFGGQA